MIMKAKVIKIKKEYGYSYSINGRLNGQNTLTCFFNSRIDGKAIRSLKNSREHGIFIKIIYEKET